MTTQAEEGTAESGGLATQARAVATFGADDTAFNGVIDKAAVVSSDASPPHFVDTNQESTVKDSDATAAAVGGRLRQQSAHHEERAEAMQAQHAMENELQREAALRRQQAAQKQAAAKAAQQSTPWEVLRNMPQWE